ncbi:potassium channel protein [Clostridium estertheticum]|uniref:potassium channel family protein n=1 Tax=Clostridium estertheticum TaxID=238834 RepID=UPI001C0E2BEA|nr:potassium channel protein [Clostridium estertheticum]MBU3199939.1 potassium channel protein [Clostridium estertheticum]WAG66963.1 potassium channel protein [Clostridium estertheticum]
MEGYRKFNLVITILIALLLIGTLGYKLLLDVSIVDALYMTVITISTVGYAEVAIMDANAKLFTIFLIFLSLGTVGYIFSSIVSYFLEGDLKDAWRRRRMEVGITKLKDHYIICGGGETGGNAIKQFKKSNVPFIVIDKDEEIIKELVKNKIYAIQGDATEEEVLDKVRIKFAKGLISSLSTDADNVYTVLTAREMNSNLYIVSRAINKNANERLKKAGANNTISPNEIGGSRMAALMLRPTVIAFLDIVTHDGELILDLEDVTICEGSIIINMSLMEAKIPEKTGLIVLAIKKDSDKKLVFNPSSNQVLEMGDTMVVLGTEEQVSKLKKIAKEI